MKKDKFEVLALLFLLLLVIAIWWKTSSPMAIESKNLAFAGVFVDAVKPSLLEDERFVHVMIDVSSLHNGTILVRGSVSSNKTRDALIHYLDQRFPPRPIDYQLQILNESENLMRKPSVFSKLHAVDLPREKRIIVEEL